MTHSKHTCLDPLWEKQNFTFVQNIAIVPQSLIISSIHRDKIMSNIEIWVVFNPYMQHWFPEFVFDKF